MFLLSTDLLRVWRAGIIGFVTLACAPWETMFDIKEVEKQAREEVAKERSEAQIISFAA